MKALRTARQVAPHPALLTMALLGLGSLAAAQIWWSDSEVWGEVWRILNGFALLGILLGSAFYGFWRACAFNPFMNRRYGDWLANTPWTSQQPLPFGPVRLVWIDVVIVAVGCAYAACFPTFGEAEFGTLFRMGPIPAVAFLAGHLLGLWLSLMRTGVKPAVLLVVFVPFLVFPHRSLAGALIVLAGFYLFCHWGFKRAMAQFPDGLDQFRHEPSEELQQAAWKLINWPQTLLAEPLVKQSLSIGQAAALAAILSFWAYVFLWIPGELLVHVVDRGDVPLVAGLAAAALAVGRFAVYRCRHAPPIDLWGRIRNGIWRLRGYDPIYLAPLGILAAGLIIGVPSAMLGLPLALTLALDLWVLIFVALMLPPDFREWHYCGHHSFFAPPRLTEQQQDMQARRELRLDRGRRLQS